MQRSLNKVYRLGVYSEKGKRVGRVHNVLFYPDRPVVVGYVVERPRLLLLFDRKDRYLAHDRVIFDEQGMRITSERGAWGSKAASRLGIDWDGTVVWSGMPVVTQSGAVVATVRDALFDTDTGELQALGLSGGVAADVAVGTTDIPARMVIGYADGAVVVRDEALEVEASGGVAQAAGKGAAVARVHVEEAAEAAGKAAKTAVAYGKSAARVAAESETGKKAVGWLRSIRDEIVDAMGDPDEDE